MHSSSARLATAGSAAGASDPLAEVREHFADVLDGKYKLHKLEDSFPTSTAVLLRRQAVAHYNEQAREMEDLPVFGSDFNAEEFYDQIHGVNCENVIGFLPLPVGVIGPLLLNGKEYYVPMATTEGALLASTNRGARAIREAGGANARVVQDVMSRAPVLELESACAAADFAAEIPELLESMKEWFATQTNFGKLESVTPTVAGRYVYLRFRASTGDAMGMNMVGKGVNKIMEKLMENFPGVKLVALSSNMCTDKKPSALNWVTGRGKSVVCETVLSSDIVERVLNTSVKNLVRTHTIKNLMGSSLAGSIGGNNAHASNIVSAAFLATGQDPAQNVESSNCMLVMDELDDGSLHVSVTMPSLEVGTVGGGTSLASQRACLDMLGVGGANREAPGSNSRELAQIIAATVLAGELSLNSALASNELISAHMDLNRKKETSAAPSVSASAPSTSFTANRPEKRLSHTHDRPRPKQHLRQQYTGARHFTARKPRSNRKVKSMVDICDDLVSHYEENPGFQASQMRRQEQEEDLSELYA